MPTVERKHGVSSGTIDASNKRTSTETWIVTAAPLGTYNHYTVCLIAGLPAIGARDSSGIALCKSKTSKLLPDKDQSAWEVDCEYEFAAEPGKSGSRQNPNDPAATDPDPEKRTPSYRWGDIRKDKVLDKDVDGEAIVNSCKKKFPKTLMQDVYYGTLSITRKMQTYDYALYAVARGCINKDRLTLTDPGKTEIGAKQARLVSVTAVEYFEAEWEGYEVTFNFELSNTSWNPLKVLDEGYTYWKTGQAGDPDVPFTDGVGRPTGKADLLDGHGYKHTGTGAYFIDVKAYTEMSMQDMIFKNST